MNDGKMTVMDEAGTYKVAGDKISMTHKGKDDKDETDVVTIKSNTDDKLVIYDEKKKQESELIKVKK